MNSLIVNKSTKLFELGLGIVEWVPVSDKFFNEYSELEAIK